MPIPNFKDTLQADLAPGITIVQDGDYFNEETPGLSIKQMNEELTKSTTADNIEFMPPEGPRKDLSFEFFINSKNEAI